MIYSNLNKEFLSGNDVVKNLSLLILKEREILSLAGDAEGTVSLMSDYISQTEKTLWLLTS